jgi:steroid delta-isomerase-like uncharacterized protein
MAPSDPEANKALVRAHYDAVTNGHDPDAIRAQVADDFFDHASGRRMSADEVIAHSRALHATFAELSATEEAMIAEGDLVAARIVWRGVHVGPWRGIPPTGQRVEFRGMTFWRIRGGKIAERWAEVDFAGLQARLMAAAKP